MAAICFLLAYLLDTKDSVGKAVRYAVAAIGVLLVFWGLA